MEYFNGNFGFVLVKYSRLLTYGTDMVFIRFTHYCHPAFSIESFSATEYAITPPKKQPRGARFSAECPKSKRRLAAAFVGYSRFGRYLSAAHVRKYSTASETYSSVSPSHRMPPVT